ncbi:hypothetical protein DFP72DRAFT_1067937 [Ephemerocybe angulata]|uniref:Ribonuclease H1 N-terminal domain-containing protein n=1 Tax=Ephemerocybe angulata TaxID=980116 RepID=A0A8H6HY28_9AGAR|nr:hypothetical protein DFP72DRAFT_1067937 [Tulosesus angulatus]
MTEIKPNLARLVGSITLSQLIEALHECGVEVTSPHQDMVEEEAARNPGPSTTVTPRSPTEAVLPAVLVALSELAIGDNNNPAPAAAPTPAEPVTSPTNTPGAANDKGKAKEEADDKGKAKEEADDKGKAKVKVDNDDEKPQSQSKGDLISGFVCAACNTHNLLRPAKDTWYCVTAGRQVGIFQGWPTVQPLVIGVRGSCFKKYSSEADALTAFERATAAGTVVVLP